MILPPKKAYKVSEITLWGHVDNEKYFLSPIAAEKDFHSRVREGITSPDLPTRDDMDGSSPWEVKREPNRLGLSPNKLLEATIHYWDSYETDCGTESDIRSYDIVLEVIKFQGRV